MATYKIPVVWQMYGHHTIEANSLEEAVQMAMEEGTPDGEYVDDSYELDHPEVVDTINGGLSEADDDWLGDYTRND